MEQYLMMVGYGPNKYSNLNQNTQMDTWKNKFVLETKVIL